VTLVELMEPMLGLELTGIKDDPDEDVISLTFGHKYLLEFKVDENGDIEITAAEASSH
jgi:hypothetical protein